MRKLVQPLGAIVPILAMCLSAPAASTTRSEIDDPDKLPAGLYPALVGAIQSSAPAEYDVAPGRGTRAAAPYRARSAAQDFDISFGTAAPMVADAQGRHVRLEITGYGHAGDLGPVPPARLVADGNRVEYRRGGPADGSAPLLTEWYVNGPLGLEQGFTLAAPPPGTATGQLVVALAVTGDLTPALADNGRDLSFLDAEGAPVLRYHGLYAFDATGRQLPAELALDGGTLAIQVEATSAAYPVTIDPLITKETKLTADIPTGLGDFGLSIAISGDTLVVGSDSEDMLCLPGGGCLFTPGSVYVFVRGETGWVLQATLQNTGASLFESFGASVAIDGDTVAVGAPGADSTGAVYVFVRSGATWSLQERLPAGVDTPAGSRFGESVAISGDTLIAGAPLDYDNASSIPDTFAGGTAYVSERSGTDWSTAARLPLRLDPSEQWTSLDQFGASVSIDGDTVVVGAPFALDDYAEPIFATRVGAAYTYERSDVDWSGPERLNIGTQVLTGDQFGAAVSISGDYVAVGAPLDDDGGPDAGVAYLFERNAGEWSGPIMVTSTDPAAAPGDRLGAALAVSGKTLVVGAPGKSGGAGEAYVFIRGGTSPAWQLSEVRHTLAPTGTPPAAGDGFGSAVAVDGEGIAVGVPSEDITGSAFVYDLPPTAKDFNGDGISDLLWRRPIVTGCNTSIWQMKALATQDVACDWQVQGFAVKGVGDFNADGQDDILWRNESTGSVVIWQMDGLVREEGQSIGAPILDWKLIGVGDFNGDRHADILWSKLDSEDRQIVRIWQMDGFTIASNEQVTADGRPEEAWRVVGIDDFNNDGFDDILWQRNNFLTSEGSVSTHAPGDVALWLMDGFVQVDGDFVSHGQDENYPDGTCTEHVTAPCLPLIWKVQGVGDFDLDGMADILWRRSDTGGTVIWKMNGAQKMDGAVIGAPDLGWEFVNIADYSGDGHADILWRQVKSPQNVTLADHPHNIWQMKGYTREAARTIGIVDQSWKVQ